MIKKDTLWPNGPYYYYDDTLFQPSTDSFLLASFMRVKNGLTVCDLGTGIGLLPMLLCGHNPSMHITGIEINKDACLIAEQNFNENKISGSIICGNIKDRSILPPQGSFDAVISNPPYFRASSGFVAKDQRGIARADIEATIEDICKCANYLVKFGGTFTLVFRSERLVELFQVLNTEHFEPKRLRFIQNKTDSVPTLFLLECKKGGKPGLSVEAPLLLKDNHNLETFDYQKAYFRNKES